MGEALAKLAAEEPLLACAFLYLCIYVLFAVYWYVSMDVCEQVSE